MSEVKSPGPNSDQFDTLIELLATDDASDDSNFHIALEGTASTGLRDASGKLDYTKIRSLFLKRRANNDDNPVLISDSFHDEPNSGIRLPQIVVEEPTALTEGPFLPTALVPERDAKFSEIEAVPMDGDVRYSQSVLPPEASGDSLVHCLQEALSKAKEEVEQLRRHVLQLQTQATELFKSNPSQEEREMGDARGYLASTTKPAVSTLSNVQDAFATGTTAPTGATNIDRSDMERAIQFLIRTDELVWRRSRYPNSSPAPVFSQSNIDAMTERLTLWENIVRAPTS
ncbi:hypothetical protein BJV74DRAFT_597465 [Russula compacta]|nr:hypothetical protein BJV74DRAFT_597465 [Russula compacta]